LCYWCSVSHQQSVTHTNGADTIFRLDPYTDKSFSYFLFLKTLQSPPLVKKREKKNQYIIILFLLYNFSPLNQNRLNFFCVVVVLSRRIDFSFSIGWYRLRVAYHNWCCVCVPKEKSFLPFYFTKDDVSFPLADGLLWQSPREIVVRRRFGNGPYFSCPNLGVGKEEGSGFLWLGPSLFSLYLCVVCVWAECVYMYVSSSW
jgi:hypothetical protein